MADQAASVRSADSMSLCSSFCLTYMRYYSYYSNSRLIWKVALQLWNRRQLGAINSYDLGLNSEHTNNKAMARTELHTCRTPACLAFAESADASGIVASRKSLERMTDSRNGTSPQAPVESVPRHSHTHYSARRYQIPNPPKRFVSCVPFWGRHSLSEQEKNKAPKQ